MAEEPSKKILLIEDEHDICNLYALHLEKAGFDVTRAYDGVTGISEYEKGDFDVILLDIILPDISGLEVLKKMRPDDKVAKIIMLTNLTADKTINEAYDNGADGYLLKATLTKDSLVEEIQTFLDE